MNFREYLQEASAKVNTTDKSQEVTLNGKTHTFYYADNSKMKSGNSGKGRPSSNKSIENRYWYADKEHSIGAFAIGYKNLQAWVNKSSKSDLRYIQRVFDGQKVF